MVLSKITKKKGGMGYGFGFGFNVKIKNNSNRRHHHHHHSRHKLPKGNWIETAKDIRIKGDRLRAKLQNRKGVFVNAQTFFRKGDHFENVDGKFVLVSSGFSRRSYKFRSSKFNKRYFNTYHKNHKYVKDAFGVYYRGRKTSINTMGFQDLGHGYARDSFNVYYKGKKIDDCSTLNFQVLGKGYAKDSFNVYHKGDKMSNLSPLTFKVF